MGFADASAGCLPLCWREFEAKLKDFQGSVPRAATELAKDWRMDRSLRRLEAMMIAADKEHLLLVSGTGDVIQPGRHGRHRHRRALRGPQLPAAQLLDFNLDAQDIVRKAMEIAGELLHLCQLLRNY